ncbi:diguanylate cyclase [Mycoplasmatota bacterium WC30]
MSLFLWLLFIFVGVISILPLARLDMFNINKRYSHFKYITIYLSIWTMITLLRYVISNTTALYYLSLAIYPLIFMITAQLFIAILKYLEKPVYKIYKWIIGVFLIADMAVSYSNVKHQLMLELLPSSNLVFSDFNNVAHGPLFFVHTIVCYLLLLVAIILIFHKLYKNLKLEQDIMPFLILIIGIVVGVVLNQVHVFFHSFALDPTYIAFVLIVTLLYFIFYIRDLRLILEFKRNNFILENLREMYLIVNQRDEVVDASEEFLQSFSIDLSHKHTFNNLINLIEEKAVIYENSQDIEGEFDHTKRYLHMQIKIINLPLFKYSGKFCLFYDETNNQIHINNMNYVLTHDSMTDLYNRNYFEEIKATIDETHESYVLTQFDLDGLKLYNDYLGHYAGDKLVIDFANQLNGFVEKYDYMAIRMGGDEFLVISKDEDVEKVKTLFKEFSENYSIGANRVLFSYGVAYKESKLDNLEEVLKRADKLMYDMKKLNAPAKEKLKKYLSNNI